MPRKMALDKLLAATRHLERSPEKTPGRRFDENAGAALIILFEFSRK